MATRTRTAALALLCAADLLVMLDGMVVTVALPAIERDLGTAHADLQWVVTAYTLSLGSFLLIGGRAGDLYGRRRALVAGLSVFALASLAAGLAPSTAALLAARAVQGFGAALAVPAALALLSAAYRQGRERERARCRSCSAPPGCSPGSSPSSGARPRRWCGPRSSACGRSPGRTWR
jgi:MFS family permease